MFFKKEREVVELVLKHLDTVEACLVNAINAVDQYLSKNMAEAKDVVAKEASDIQAIPPWITG